MVGGRLGGWMSVDLISEFVPLNIYQGQRNYFDSKKLTGYGFD